MSRPVAKPVTASVYQASIIHNAQECEQALKLADFADRESMPDIAYGMRKLAAFHSEIAFRSSESLARMGGAA